ncbi:MAG: saccharopine dehydrogenase C-terminal domain-containing protein [Thermoplasmataceae archaeon]
MYDFAVIGAGHIGGEISRYLSNSGSCILMDRDSVALSRSFSTEKMKGTVGTNPEFLKKSEIFVVALPGSVAKETVSSLLHAGKRVIDVSFYDDDPFFFESSVGKDSVYIPDCGFAPGLSNMMVGYLSSKYSSKKIGIYVGGLPVEPREPFLHSITWSVEGFIDEYTRPAKIVEKGKVVSKDPLGKKFEYTPNAFPHLEGFYSDGLRTLLRTTPAEDLFEVTLRYMGHLDRMKFLKDMGFFDQHGKPSPRSITENIFSGFADKHDVSILDVISLDSDMHKIELRDYGDDNLTSMAKLTGHTAALAAKLLIEDSGIKGFFPPEELGRDERWFNYIFEGLRKEGVNLAVSRKNKS